MLKPYVYPRPVRAMRYRWWPTPLLAWLLVPSLLAGCLLGGPGDAGGLATLATVELSDPTIPGLVDHITADFDFGPLVIEGSEGRYVADRHRGTVTYPRGDAPDDAWPLLIFLHGRHSTCAYLSPERQDAIEPCPHIPGVVEPVDSYRGYAYLAEHLASHGMVVASVDADTMNAYDNQQGSTVDDDHGQSARARLIWETVARFRAIDEGNAEQPPEAALGRAPQPDWSALEGRIDLSRVGLMGHSRGGEGVVVAADHTTRTGTDPSVADVGLGAVLALGTSNFYGRTITDTPFLNLFGYCEGDFDFMRGPAIFYDSIAEGNRAPIHQVVLMGANHNYHNTYWTYDDARMQPWSETDPWCKNLHGEMGDGRYTPEQQRHLFVGIASGFFRTYLDVDETHAPWFDGDAQAPASVCPAGMPHCHLDIVTEHAPPRDRLLIVEDGRAGNKDGTNDLGGAYRLSGDIVEDLKATTLGADGKDAISDPLVHTFQGAGTTTYTHTIPPAFGDLRGHEALSFRISVAPDASDKDGSSTYHMHNGTDTGMHPHRHGQAITVRLTDSAGQRADVRVEADHPALLFAPGTDARKPLLGTVHIPLEAWEGVDLGAIESVAFVAQSEATVEYAYGEIALLRA